MNKQLIQKWVDTLRSGNYEQGRKALRSKDDKFCCLGVLCDISKRDLNVEWVFDDDEEIYTMEKNGGVLPDSVWEYLGRGVDYKVQISTTNPKIPSFIAGIFSPISHISLVTLNDTYNLSFDQIADILEEEFLLSGTINENKTTNLERHFRSRCFFRV